MIYLLVILFIQLAKSVLTLLYIKRKAQTSHTPDQVCDNLQSRMMKSTHDGVHFNVIEFAHYFPFEVAVRAGIEHLFLWVLPTKFADKRYLAIIRLIHTYQLQN